MYAIEVACQSAGCPAEGVRRRVHLNLVALGLVAVPQLRCVQCGAEPQETGGWLPTQDGGVSSPGKTSSTSPSKPPDSDALTKPSGQSPARKTGSASTRARPGSSTARSAAGSGGDAA